MIDFAKLEEEREKDKTTLHIVISGDKEFSPQSSLTMKVNGQDELVDGRTIFNALIERLTHKCVERGFNVVVRCGANEGVDALAQEWCKRNGHMCKQHTPNFDKGGASAGYRNCEDMFLWIGHKPQKGCLLIWDGENKYTRYMIFCAWLQSVPCKVWNYMEKRWLKPNEVEDIQMAVRQEQAQYGRYF